MLVEDAIYRRHSSTEFVNKLVLHSMVHNIINKSLSVPKFNNRSNFKIVIIHQEEGKKSQIAKKLNKYGTDHDDFQAINDSEAIDTASVLILLYKEKSTQNHKNDLLTLGALGENICLLATNHYLGTLWVDKVRKIEDDIEGIVNTKKHPKNIKGLELCYGIVLGYRNRLYSYKRDELPEGIGGLVEWL